MNALRDALGRLISFLPDLVAGLVVLAIGWGAAWLVSLGVRRALPRLGFDRFLSRHHLSRRPPEAHAGSRAVAATAAGVIFLIAFMQAANIWGLGFIAAGIARVIAYVPNLIAALVIFGGAMVVARWVSNQIQASPAFGEMKEGAGVLLPTAVRAGILTIGAFLALRQLLIAPEILVIAFTLVFGAVAVAAALAFGLGGRSAAERMTQDWYERQQGRRRRTMSEVEREARMGSSLGSSTSIAESSERPGVH